MEVAGFHRRCRASSISTADISMQPYLYLQLQFTGMCMLYLCNDGADPELDDVRCRRSTNHNYA